MASAAGTQSSVASASSWGAERKRASPSTSTNRRAGTASSIDSSRRCVISWEWARFSRWRRMNSVYPPMSASRRSARSGMQSGVYERKNGCRWKSLCGLVADGLDVVAVGIEDVGPVVVGVVPTQAGCAVVGPACLDRRGVKGVHLRPILRTQRDVEPPAYRLPFGFDEERGPGRIDPPVAGRRLGELHQEPHPQRRERLLVERLAPLVVGDGKPDVVERRHPTRPQASCRSGSTGLLFPFVSVQRPPPGRATVP